MIIAVDYDDTFTKDPELWSMVISLAKIRKHTVYCVTSREEKFGGQEVKDSMGSLVDAIYFTNGEMKEKYMLQQGIYVNVWIDDCPGMISQVTMIGM